MANKIASGATFQPRKKTMEQNQARKLNPSLTPSSMEQKRYELATFRTARKHRYQANTGSGTAGK